MYRFDDDMFCKILRVEIETDEENGDYIIATGTDICTILSGRVVRWPIVYSGTVTGFLQKVLTDNAISPAQSQRRIPSSDQSGITSFVFEIDKSNGAEFTEQIETTAFTADLLQLIITTCKTHSFGFRVSYDIEARRLVFRLYKGKNKALPTGDEYVEFSPQFANILSSNYVEDESEYKNVAYVGYKSGVEGDEQTYLLSVFKGTTEPQGEARREVYVDGTGINRSITYEELLLMYPTATKESETVTEDGKQKIKATYYATIGGTKTAVATSEQDVVEAGAEAAEEKITVTDYTYLSLERALGYDTLAEHIEKQEFTGEVDTINTYEYKTDYELGDIVKVINDHGIAAEARIVEIVESDDTDNGYQIEPKFEYFN